MRDKTLDIRMLMPCESDKRPVAPLDYTQWLFNSIGHDNLLIRFLAHSRLVFEQYDSYTYIYYRNDHCRKDEFIRYDIKNDIIYIWEDGGTQITKVSELINYCKSNDIKILLETPKECTYGNQTDLINKG